MATSGKVTRLPAQFTFHATIFVVYAATGYAGLKLGLAADQLPLIWLPSGIAFAAAWMGGVRMMPGAFIGAFLVNFWAFGAWAPALIVAAGAMLPAIVTARLLLAWGASGRLNRAVLSDLAFIGVAVLAGPVLSAAVGAVVIAWVGAGGPAYPSPSTFAARWLADATGVLLMAPAILLAGRWLAHRWTWRFAAVVSGFLVGCVAVVLALAWLPGRIWVADLYKLSALMLSLAAVGRFGLHGGAAVNLLMALGACAVTVSGLGPFIGGNPSETLALLHAFVFAQTLTAQLSAAVMADLRRALSLERSARALAEAIAASRFRLMAMISHDVRTPLSGLVGVMQVLARSPHGPEQRRLIDLGLRAGRTLADLVADILESARTDASAPVIRLVPFDPDRSLDQVVRLQAPAAVSKGLSLSYRRTEALPSWVAGDRLRFEQVVGNLVSNAVTYTPSGGIWIEADWRSGARLPLQIEVRDTGPGLDPLTAPRMFEAFVQGPTAAALTGFGLSLDICRRLTEAMGGEMTYARRDGESLFRVALPFPASEPPPVSLLGAPSRALSILLVEDDPISREVTAALLRTVGHQVEAAADEDEAIARAAGQVFDLILLDIDLGRGGSGLALARRLRAELSVPPAIVALTGSDVPASAALDLDGVIVKPLDADTDLSRFLSAEASSRSRVVRPS